MSTSESQQDLKATLKLAKDIGLYQYRQQLPAAVMSPHKSKYKISRADWRIITSKLETLHRLSPSKKSTHKARDQENSHKRQLSENNEMCQTFRTQLSPFKEMSFSNTFHRSQVQTARPSTTNYSPRRKLTFTGERSNRSKKIEEPASPKKQGLRSTLTDRQKRRLLLNLSNDIGQIHSFEENPEQRMRFIHRSRNTMKLRFNKKVQSFEFS